MNIDSQLSYPKQLIGGERREKGTLQIFYKSTDTQPPRYSTGLNGTYDLTLLDLKVISSAATAEEYCVEMLSDTFRIDRGNLNDNFKFVHRNGAPELPNPVKFRQATINNYVEVDFQQLGTIQDNINANDYYILLTFEYERL